MTIEKLEEFASNGDKHLTGLDVATGFPRADKPERPWFNKLFGDITGKINEVVDNIDELPPFEGGVLADTLVTVTANGVGAVTRNLHDKNSDFVSIKSYGATGTGDVDDSIKINAHIAETQGVDKTATYYYFPNRSESYRVDSPIKFSNGGVLIFGFRGGSYNSNLGATGNIVVNNPICGFDLGGSRTTGATDGWEVRNIGFVQHPSLPVTSTDAIRMTPKTDGPDRGVTFKSITARGMNRAIYIPSNSATVMAATLVIESCYLNNNNHALVVEQKIEGLRFVGNQAEQNKVGGIDVVVNGGVTITDNMLEGQRNAVNIRGVKPRVEIKRNYFEANSGDYVIQFTAVSSEASLELSGNYAVVLAPDTDYCRILSNQYNYAYKVVNDDNHPVTLVEDASISVGSRLTNDKIDYYYSKGFKGTLGHKIFTDNFINTLPDLTYSQMNIRNEATAVFVNSPQGKVLAPLPTDYLYSVMPVLANDVLSFSCIFKIDQDVGFTLGYSAINIDVADNLLSSILDGDWVTAYVSGNTAGKYILFNGVVRSKKDTGTVLFRLRNADRPVQMIAASVKNLGQVDGKFKMSQTVPVIKQDLYAKISIVSTDIAINSEFSQTVSLTGANLGDFVHVSYNKDLTGLELKAWVSAKNTIKVVFTNKTDAIKNIVGVVKVSASS